MPVPIPQRPRKARDQHVRTERPNHPHDIGQGRIGLTGPNGISLTMANQAGIKGAFFAALASGAIPQSGGTFTFTGTGGADVGSFTSTLMFTNPLISWTNRSAAATIQMGGQNVGDLCSAANVRWCWFQRAVASPGYQPGQPDSDDPSAVCTSAHTNILGASQLDYNPHHEPFQYYQSTANPTHLPPTSVAAIGQQDQANHQYDLKDFLASVDGNNMPAVAYLKAADYQDGHAGYSNPLDEQTFLAYTINHLQKSSSWKDTAVVILYDDSDGWYDHQFGPIVTQSRTMLDGLSGTGLCGANPSGIPSGQQARCGAGMRQPLLAISPFSKSNYVDSTFTTQASVVQFIEDNWLAGQRIGGGSVDDSTGSLNNLFDFQHANASLKLLLDPSTGEPSTATK